MTSRGFSLVHTMALALFSFALSAGVIQYVAHARSATDRHRSELQARCLAADGLTYSRAMVAHGRWKQSLEYRSPNLGTGYFVVRLRRDGSRWRAESTGFAARSSFRIEQPVP